MRFKFSQVRKTYHHNNRIRGWEKREIVASNKDN